MNENFAGCCQGASDAIARAEHPLSKTPPAAPEGLVPASGAIFSPAFPLLWTRERAERLHRACKMIERRRSAGVPVRKAVKYFAWFWKNRAYLTEPNIPARFGRSRLVTLYYHWRRNGKSPACLELHYGDRRASITAEEMRRFVDACGTSGTKSMSQAARLAGFERARACRILARLPRRVIRRIKAVFKERRQAESEARKAVTQLQARLHRLLQADRCRTRRLGKLAESFIGRREGGGMDSTSFEKDRAIQPIVEIFKWVLRGVSKSGIQRSRTMADEAFAAIQKLEQLHGTSEE